MVYTNILKEDLSKLNLISSKLLIQLSTVNELLVKKDEIHNLEKAMKALELINTEYQVQLLEVENLVRSTHYNKLSVIVEISDNDELIAIYNETIELTKKIHQENKQVRSLLELCQRLTDNHINLLFGKTQKPTNYNIDKRNLNLHMLNRLKNSK